MYAASSDARKSTALATSSGAQSLGIGYSASDASMYSGVALPTAPGVSVRPGATALHRIPRAPYCEATDFVNRTTPALDAPHAASDEAVDRGSVDDRAATARQHVRDRVLAAHELAFQVDGDKSVEDRHVEGDDVRVNGVGRRVSRVVVQHIEAAERRHCSFDHAHDARLV